MGKDEETEMNVSCSVLLACFHSTLEVGRSMLEVRSLKSFSLLIICREAGREEITYALDGLEEKIFIAKYKVMLPSEERIKRAIKKL